MTFSALFIGNESLLIHCAEIWRARGHAISAVVTHNAEVAAWARDLGLATHAPGAIAALKDQSYDWLFSIANLSLVPEPVLAAARLGAVNFHDGPLPRHAGLNAPVWALLAGERHHGITWHLIEGGIDEGDILEQRLFDIAPTDTALTLNTRCFEAAIESFPALATALESGSPPRRKQDFENRSYHARDDRPRAGGQIDPKAPTEAICALVRALDHGSYRNPLSVAKLKIGAALYAVASAEPAAVSGAPGEVLAVNETDLTFATGDGAVTLRGLRDLQSKAVCPKTIAQPGTRLPDLTEAEAQTIDRALGLVARHEGRIRKILRAPRAAEVPGVRAPGQSADWRSLPLASIPLAATALWAARLSGGETVDLALSAPGAGLPGHVAEWSPLRLDAPADQKPADLALSAEKALQTLGTPGFALDLALRDPAISALVQPQIALAPAPLKGSVITIAPEAFYFDAARLDPLMADLLRARLLQIAEALPEAQSLAEIPAMPEAERQLTLSAWNATGTPYDPQPIHRAFEAQVARTPEAIALVHEDRALTFAELEAAANRAAHLLRAEGVGPGTLVGLATGRSALLLIGALGILKAGGGYVPMDPAYPADRLALYLEDSGATVVITDAKHAVQLPQASVQLVLDRDPRLADQPDTPPEGGAGPEDIAYMIYTSGSTGRPKGVMIAHRNAANFFAGMDQRIGTAPGSWLAVTSLSFDISVLELFWTLSRGFKLVLMGDADRALVSNGPAVSAQGMEFSLYYWGNDDTTSASKYELLMEGAKFADQNGFCAVWTPERHFHAFGGPYPNPAVTGAAVAGVTSRIGVRAGSCVAPLHHPARIAEDWAVIDNLTQGRAGLAMASGWQPDDFVLRPENTPPKNRQALFDSIDQVRRLWRGEAVEFPTASGAPFAVVTQPRPISKELPVWVTTAGNPETWREAGAIGANVLTHLLGQSIQEVADKIAIYHEALRKAGHDPANHTVTLMLHTYLAADREAARNIAREPMKDYLRSAAGLIKQYAWAFPAFKKPQGLSNPMEIDLSDLSGDEMEAILEFAFQRYFEDSGLFGTIEDAMARVEELKRIGVTEIACLIDYGIPTATVLEGLRPLAEVVARANSGGGPAADDFSIAAQIHRHGVTHLQCTPSMARMLAMNDEARAALARLDLMMIGGEALPGTLVADLNRAGVARILNMYGPTETTIWSTTETARAEESTVNIGTPIANTQVYVLNEAMEPQPVGQPGELWIGGEGVARGYWQREDLTAERFIPNPFHPGRMYRTGDLVRWRADGRLDFLGRADFQVKLRGYRIELGEIEAVAETFPGVRQAVVMAREDSPGDLRLVAYVTGDSWMAVEGLRAHIAARLPEHMVPAHVVKIGEFPLTPNRKVDRKALPPPTATATRPESFEPPTEGVQAVIAGVWQRVLNLPSVGARDNFFALGGHSLLAVQAHREIRAALGGGKLSITDIFRFPTLQALAEHLGGGAKPAESAAPPVALLDRAMSRTDAMSARRALRAQREA